MNARLQPSVGTTLKKTLHNVKEVNTLALLKADMREVLKERDATKAAHSLPATQLEKVISKAKKEPPARRGEGKQHRATAQAKTQGPAEKTAKQSEAEATERASAEHAEALRPAKKVEAEAAERASTKRAEAQREAKQAAMLEAAKREAAEAHQKADRE